MKLKKLSVKSFLAGTFSLDGGAMFGSVPKTLWSKFNKADENNRISLSCRCFIIETKDKKIIIDTGIGTKFDEKSKKIYNIDHSKGTLLKGLKDNGLTPEEITDVIITHLHFDHAGGVTHINKNGELKLTFPNATHHIQRQHWFWSQHPTEKDKASFIPLNYNLLSKSGNLHLVEGSSELLPGVEVVISEGHTTGMQIVLIKDDSKTLCHCADLMPTTTHIRIPYVMAYDIHPLNTIEEKKMLLAQAMEGDWILMFGHDPEIAACKLKEEKGKVIAGKTINI